MSREIPAIPPQFTGTWASVTSEPEHSLAALEGAEIAGAGLRVLLGPRSRFGARYFLVLLERGDSETSVEAALSGLHRSGPLPSYNWVEVAETREAVALPAGGRIEIGEDGVARLFELLLGVLPPGGHLMVEYDSAQRAETARALAQNVPAVATALGALLFKLGFGARFKDWQIAEGGAEGPRKLQAYKPPAPEHERRWRAEAGHELRAFLQRPTATNSAVEAARERARALLPLLDAQ